MNVKYTKELLEPAVASSFSIAEVMRKIGLKETGGSHAHIKGRIKYYEIDNSHFNGKFHNRGKVSVTKKGWKDILIKRKKGKRCRAYQLKRALIEYGKKYECEICNLQPMWNNKKLRLQVDHIIPDWLDDRPENLRFLCPNCHSQTDNFCKRKAGMAELEDAQDLKSCDS